MTKAPTKKPKKEARPVGRPSINWDHVSSKVVAIARNEEGLGLCFSKIPRISGDYWACSGGEVYLTWQFASYTHDTCDWKDSLVVRPGYDGE